MKDKIRLLPEIIKEYIPIGIVFLLLLLQVLVLNSKFSYILIAPPWIIVLIIYTAKKNIYHKIGFNTPQIEIILESIGATETTVKEVIEDYKFFIKYETREKSQVAKYFYSKESYSKSKYTSLTSECSLSHFCLMKELIALCNYFRFHHHLMEKKQIMRFAERLYSTQFYEWIYKCTNVSLDYQYYYFGDIVCEYIIYSVLNKKEISYEKYLSFALDLCAYKYKNLVECFVCLINNDENISEELKNKQPNGYNYESYIREIGYL